MKKLFFVMIAMMAIAFTGCKVETSTVTVAVEDTAGNPVANCPVIYADYASIIIGGVIPSPDDLLLGTESYWNVAQTNAQGTVQIQIPLAVAKIKYCFGAYDSGTMEWKTKDVELHRGVNEEVKIVVNR